jgi:histidyl-tRNA synthetase
LGALKDLGIPVLEDPFLVRGLDYYKRTAFEVHAGALGAQNAVAGGGRYDGLTELLGGSSAPGIGFAVGVERLVLLLKEKGEKAHPKIRFYLAPLVSEAEPVCFRLAHKLRAQGYSVASDNLALRLKNHLKRADKLNVQTVLMLGEDELSGSYLTARDLESGTQSQVPIAEFLTAGTAPEKIEL